MAAIENRFVKVGLHQFEFWTAGEDEFNELIFSLVDQGTKDPVLFAHYNLHGLYYGLCDEKFAQFLRKVEYAWIDGFPILRLLKLVNKTSIGEWRLTFLDWQESFLALANSRSSRVFLLGGTENTSSQAKYILQAKYPRIDFFSNTGYFNHRDNSPIGDNKRVIDAINASQPDILLIGMGMPLQEKWILDNSAALRTSVILPLGGYFEYLAGTARTPNRWLSRLGLEWLIRLFNDPFRLYRRYLIEPWYVAFRLLKFHWWDRS